MSEDLLDQIDLYRARCTHLRDDTLKVQAKAFNLLNEDVLDILRLVEAALDRPNPKLDVALHHLQLVIEDVEAAVPFFDSRSAPK